MSLTLSRTGYEAQTFKIDLEPGKTTKLARTLKEAPKFGTVKFDVKLADGRKGGWGVVFVSGKKYGRTDASLRLPVGRITLHLVNDGDKTKLPIQWDATCDVTEDGPNLCPITLP